MRTADRIQELRLRRERGSKLRAKDRYTSRKKGIVTPKGSQEQAVSAMEGIKNLYENNFSRIGSWIDTIEEETKTAELPDEQTRLDWGGMSNRALYTVEGEEIAPEMSLRPAPRWDGPTGISGDIGGREAAEQYLGRKLDDKEWEMLARTTYAEATNNPEEQAAIMSVILNRVASDSFGDTVTDVVNQKNQFQAVTGTKDDPGPSERFRAFDEEVLQDFEENVTPRLSNFQEQGWLNFTSGNPAAYGPGTNLGFLQELLNTEGSARIGGTIFGTLR